MPVDTATLSVLLDKVTTQIHDHYTSISSTADTNSTDNTFLPDWMTDEEWQLMENNLTDKLSNW